MVVAVAVIDVVVNAVRIVGFAAVAFPVIAAVAAAAVMAVVVVVVVVVIVVAAGLFVLLAFSCFLVFHVSC